MVTAHNLANHGKQLSLHFCAMFNPAGYVTHKLVIVAWFAKKFDGTKASNFITRSRSLKAKQ